MFYIFNRRKYVLGCTEYVVNWNDKSHIRTHDPHPKKHRGVIINKIIFLIISSSSFFAPLFFYFHRQIKRLPNFMWKIKHIDVLKLAGLSILFFASIFGIPFHFWRFFESFYALVSLFFSNIANKKLLNAIRGSIWC